MRDGRDQLCTGRSERRRDAANPVFAVKVDIHQCIDNVEATNPAEGKDRQQHDLGRKGQAIRNRNKRAERCYLHAHRNQAANQTASRTRQTMENRPFLASGVSKVAIEKPQLKRANRKRVRRAL